MTSFVYTKAKTSGYNANRITITAKHVTLKNLLLPTIKINGQYIIVEKKLAFIISFHISEYMTRDSENTSNVKSPSELFCLAL